MNRQQYHPSDELRENSSHIIISPYLPTNVEMKFPCSYFVQWRTVNSKCKAKTEKYRPTQQKVTFNQRIKLSIEMIYDHAKQTIVQLFLVSKSRPDQVRMVGRVSIDVSKVINVGMYLEPTIFQLSFSSVQGTIIMQFKPIQQVLTSMSINDLDRSSFAQYITRKDFKSHNKYESIVLAKYQNRSRQKSLLEKSFVSDPSATSRLEYRQTKPNKDSILNDSIILPRQPQKDQSLKRETIKIQNSFRYSFANNTNGLEDVNQSFSKNNDNCLKQDPQITRLTKQISQLRKQISDFQDHIKSLSQFNKEKSIQIDDLKALISKQAFQLSSKTQVNKNLQSEIEKLKRQIKELKNINLKHSQLNEQLSAQLRSLTQQNIKNKQQISYFKTQIKEICEYNQQLKKQSASLTQLNNELRQKLPIIKTQQLQIEKLREQLKCELIKHEKLNHFKNRGDSLELQNKLLAERLKEQQRNGLAYQSKFIELQQLVVRLEEANQKCNQRVRQSEQIELQLRNKIQQLQIQNNHLMTSMQNERQQFQRVNQGLKIQMDIIKSEASTYADQVFMLKNQLQSARSSLQQKNSAQQGIFHLLNKCQSYQETINHLNNSLQEELNRNHDLNQQIIEYSERQISLKQNLRLLQEQSNNILMAYRERQENQKRLVNIIEALKKKHKQQSIVVKQQANNAANQKSAEYWQQRALLLKKKKMILQNQRSLLMSNSEAQTHQRQLKAHIQNIILKRSKSKSALEERIKQLADQYSASDQSRLTVSPSQQATPNTDKVEANSIINLVHQ